MPRHGSRLLACLALAVALFLAQAGALLHASSHVDDPTDRSGIHAQLCSQCLSFSAVLSMAAGPGTPFALPNLLLTVLAGAALLSLVTREAPGAFRSRAPPRPR